MAERWKGIAEALAQIGKIFSLTQSLDKPIGQEQKSGKAHQKTVNEIHEMKLRSVSVAATNSRLRP
jgi:hypothetical protein